MGKTDDVKKIVRSGNVRRLKRYLKYHTFHLNKPLNDHGHTALHVACRKQHADMVLFLLENGADPIVKDHKGNIALLLALKAGIFSRRMYRKIVSPLLNASPMSFMIPNRKNETCKKYLKEILEIIEQKEQKQGNHSNYSQSQTAYFDSIEGDDPCNNYENEFENKHPKSNEDDWNEKLRNEMDYEYGTNEGLYEDFYDYAQSSESYDAWAERIRAEHRERFQNTNQHTNARNTKKNPHNPSHESTSNGSSSKGEQFCWDRAQAKQKDYQDEKKRRMEKMLQHKKKSYEHKLKKLFHEEDVLTSSDVPDADSTFIAILLSNLTDDKEKKQYLKEQQYVWHPDKFLQKCGCRIQEDQRQRILDKVNKISQVINGHLQEM